MISEQDLRSLPQVSVQDLHERSPGKMSVQDLYKRELCCKISVIDLLARFLSRSLEEVSWQDLWTRYLLARSLYEISVLSLSTKAFWARFM